MNHSNDHCYALNFPGVEETNDKIQSNITELESYLEDALKISPNVLQSLVNATLKKDMVNVSCSKVKAC